jgi:hypothetical protein
MLMTPVRTAYFESLFKRTIRKLKDDGAPIGFPSRHERLCSSGDRSSASGHPPDPEDTVAKNRSLTIVQTRFQRISVGLATPSRQSNVSSVEVTYQRRSLSYFHTVTVAAYGLYVLHSRPLHLLQTPRPAFILS